MYVTLKLVPGQQQIPYICLLICQVLSKFTVYYCLHSLPDCIIIAGKISFYVKNSPEENSVNRF